MSWLCCPWSTPETVKIQLVSRWACKNKIRTSSQRSRSDVVTTSVWRVGGKKNGSDHTTVQQCDDCKGRNWGTGWWHSSSHSFWCSSTNYWNLAYWECFQWYRCEVQNGRQVFWYCRHYRRHYHIVREQHGVAIGNTSSIPLDHCTHVSSLSLSLSMEDPFVSSHRISGSSVWISLIHQISYSLEQQGSLHLVEVLSITPVHHPYIIFLYSNLIPQHPVPLASVWSNRPRHPQHPRAKRPRPPFLTTSCKIVPSILGNSFVALSFL